MSLIKLAPSLKEIIWGGQRLKEIYNNADMDNIAEAWVLSCHKDGQSIVAEGEYKGLTLWEAIEKMGKAVLGTRCEGAEEFPILIKFIDAADKLSVQVHPDNEYAREHENDSGKTEAWYILDSAPGAQLIYGFKETLTKDELREKIENGTLLESVNSVEVKKGDVAFIPSGTLHAIGAGIFLAEVQQGSNATYRVFDYKRKDKNGNERELNVKKAVDVVDTSALNADFTAKGAAMAFDGYTETLLTSCEYFSMSLLEIAASCSKNADESSFVSLLVLEGEGTLVCGGETLDLVKGDSVFIPAGSGDFDINGRLNVLKTRL